MKIVNENNSLTSEMIKKEIKENLGLLEDLIVIGSELIDEYRVYRMKQAVEKIRMYLKECEIKVKKEK